VVVLLAGPRHWHATRAGGGAAMATLPGVEAAFMERGAVERADAVVATGAGGGAYSAGAGGGADSKSGGGLPGI